MRQMKATRDAADGIMAGGSVPQPQDDAEREQQIRSRVAAYEQMRETHIEFRVPELRFLLARVDDLTEALAHARKDSERLDGILAKHIDFGTSSNLSVPPKEIQHGDVIVTVYPSRIFARRECSVHWYCYHCFDGMTPRDAIDAALAAPPCAERADGNCKLDYPSAVPVAEENHASRAASPLSGSR